MTTVGEKDWGSFFYTHLQLQYLWFQTNDIHTAEQASSHKGLSLHDL